MKKTLTQKTIQTLWQHAVRYKKFLWGIGVFSVLTVALDVFTPTLLKGFFDLLSSAAGVNDDTVSQLTRLVIFIAVLYVVRWLFGNIKAYLTVFFTPKFLRDLSNTCFQYLQGHSYNFFTNRQTGSLTRKVGRFIDSADRIQDFLVWNIIPLLLETVGIVIVLWLLHPVFALATIGWIILFVTTIFLYSRYKLKYDAQETAINSEVSGRLADTIANNISIKLNANLKNEVGAFKDLTQSQAKIQQLLRILNELVDTFQSAFMVVLQIVMLLLVFYFWKNNAATLGDFVLIQAYVINLTRRMWDFGRVVRQMYEGFAYCNEMTEILTMQHEVRDRFGAKSLTLSQGEILFEKVDFNYNATRSVLKKLSLNIRPGEKLGVVGHSGAGKSTLVSLLLRYYDLTGGNILIDGQDIAHVTQDSLRRSISLIPQDVLLFHRTIAENIRYGKWSATDEEVHAAAKLAFCDTFIDGLPKKYETLVGERGVKLSGGERQRIAIARAILKNAPILILDEATSSLDSGSEAAIQKSLAHLMKGKTTIVIAHRLSTLKQMDRIVVIEDGRVQEEGTHQKLLEKKGGRYKKLWDLQVGGFLKE